MLNLYKTPSHQPSHERLFIERYTRLRQWALHLTASNGDQAEDLVHDAFIQFTLARPDLATIHNLDGYLYGMLRNLHVSQLRRLSRLGYRSLSMIDYDSIEIGLRATDPRDLIRSQDELRQLCYYACVRKETSKAGSVLILRFLLGYYPREIAQVMCTTRQAVEERLRIARSEAKYYVQNPGTLRFLPEQRAARPAQAPTGFAQSTGELLHDLQRTVFAARTGDCLPPDSLKQLYSANPQTPLNGHTLSHLVSCPPCLDAANKHLGIPVLAERYPTDTLGSDTQRGGGSSSNNDGGGSSSSNNGGGGDNGDNGDNDGGGNGSSDANQSSRSLLRRAKQVFEHRPQELCIAVNGDLIAAQRISAALSEQTLKINTSERIEFIEIISEQEVRLLFLSVADAAKQDKLKSPLVQRQQSVSEQQSIKVELSDQRTLEVTLSFDKPWPTLHVSYYDPAMDSEAALIVDSGEWRVESGEVSHDAAWQSLRQGSRRHTGTAAAWMQSWLVNVFGAHPAVITAALAVLLIAAVLFIRLHATTVSAADLLRQSTAAEHTRATRLETILHRTIELEERRHGAAAATDSSNNTSVVRRRIEVWQSASSNLTMRRVYDERGRLVAGERGASVDDSSSTLRRIIYRVGDAPQTLSEPAALEINRSLDPHSSSIWRLDPSAEVFTALVGDANRSGETSIEERLGTYLVRFKRSSTLQPTAGLLEATLMLTKTDLRPINQVLVVAVRNGSNGAADETREYRFVESKFEQLQAHLVPPSVFEPEAELLRFTEVANKNAKRVREAATLSQTANDEALQSATSSSELFIPAASAELEVEATYLLNKVKANLGEQVSVARTGGKLRVEALVETQGRKLEILNALAPIINHPAVQIEVLTVDEAVMRQQQTRAKSGEMVANRAIEIATTRMPADADLRSYFAAERKSDRQTVDDEINRFADRMINRSRTALQQASALKQLVNKLSPEQTRTLAPEARAKWLAMIREHAVSYRREVDLLRRELRPIFPAAAASSDNGAVEVVTEATAAVRSAEQLLQLSYKHDEAVRSAFTISTRHRTHSAIKSAEFWRSLGTAERLAASMQNAYQ